MSFLLFLRGMVFVLVAFALTTYFATQSFWSAFLYTLLVAVLLQIGYFLAVLFVVWRTPAKKARSTAPQAETNQPSPPKAKPVDGLPG